ncbi:pyridoxamine 5'-phosphate oxidase family protein [Lysinibacillus sp. FSL H8-0500]|uniref:pyridoxamine 5'-phosphate oxidase family protein n=1 Tax=Lysinibacillus sp. FSL H8-0500 TaxID=2921393 RepID=UPI003101482D
MSKPLDMQQIIQNYKAFLQRKKTCVLSFVDGEGKPFSSPTPSVYLNGNFYHFPTKDSHFKEREGDTL